MEQEEEQEQEEEEEQEEEQEEEEEQVGRGQALLDQGGSGVDSKELRTQGAS